VTIEQQTALRGIEQQFTAALADPEFFRATVEAVVDRVRFPRAGQGWEALESDGRDVAAEDDAAEQDTMDDDAYEDAARDAPDGSALERGQTAGRTRRGKRAGRRRDRRQQE
jgi:hypothetical protein